MQKHMLHRIHQTHIVVLLIVHVTIGTGRKSNEKTQLPTIDQGTKAKRGASLSSTTSTTSGSKIMIQTIISLTAATALGTVLLSTYIQWLYKY